MSTVIKALELLDLFSIDRVEIRLSEFQRLTGRDKTTTYRYLSALTSFGLLEQDATNRAYRMGPTVLRLSHIRELTVPRRAGVRRVLPNLADVSGETAHASILQGNTLVSLANHTSSQHSARVVVDDAVLPFHATASGLAVLAFADEKLKSAAFKNLSKYTNKTITDTDELEKLLSEVRNTGFGLADHGFELGVSGIAVPLFDAPNHVAGSVAIASVTARVNDDLVRIIKRELIDAARNITTSWGGTIPHSLEAAWSATMS